MRAKELKGVLKRWQDRLAGTDTPTPAADLESEAPQEPEEEEWEDGPYDLSSYASETEINDLADDLDDQRIHFMGQGQKAEEERITEVRQAVIRNRIPDPDLGVTHPILERVWKDFKVAAPANSHD